MGAQVVGLLSGEMGQIRDQDLALFTQRAGDTVTAAPSATYLAMVAPLPIVSSSGCACTTISRRAGSSAPV